MHLGLSLFPVEEAAVRYLLSEALDAWERRAAYVEELKQDFEIFSVDPVQRPASEFNPINTLRTLCEL